MLLFLFCSQRGRGGPRNFGARGRGGRGGRGRGREKAVEKSAVELDKELDNYHAMQTWMDNLSTKSVSWIVSKYSVELLALQKFEYVGV